MNIKVTKDNVCIIERGNVHEGEYKINELSFEFSEEYSSDLVINAVFTNELGKAYQVSVIDGKCQIPAEILAETGQILLGVYAYKINGEELELRYSPFPTSFNVISGSYDPTAEESQEITPTQFEQYMQALNDGLNQVKDSISKLDNATKNANDLVDEINKKLENGDFIGPQGPIGPQGEPGKDGTNGIDGVGITTITSGQATEENGNTITPITVEKTDGSSETFNVSAKNGIDGKNGQNGKDGINGTNGIDGQDGITPNIQIGTVETLEPTEEATVTITGTDEEPLFNFGIPKGEKGEPGEVTEDTLDNVIPKQTATDSIININDALKYKSFGFKVDGNYHQETTTGKQLFNVNDKYSVYDGFTVDEDGWITINVNNTTGQSVVYANYFTKNLNLKPNTDYNVFLEVKSVSGNGNIRIASKMVKEEVQTEGQFVTYWNYDLTQLSNDKIYNKTCTSIGEEEMDNVKYGIRSFVSFGVGQSGSITFRISVIEDTSVTPENFVYEPYTGGIASPNPDYPQEITTLTFDMITRRGKNLSDYQETNYQIDLQGNELVALPNGVKDELQIDKEGNVNLIKNVGKKILNGSEEWMPNTNYTTSSMLAVQYLENSMLSNSKIISDRFTYNAVTDIDTIRASTQYILIGLDITEFTTVADFKNWLQSNNTTVYYQLAESQTINLGKLEELISTEQGSNTFAINGNIDTQISATYALDLKKYIDNKIAQVSQAIVEGE